MGSLWSQPEKIRRHDNKNKKRLHGTHASKDGDMVIMTSGNHSIRGDHHGGGGGGPGGHHGWHGSRWSGGGGCGEAWLWWRLRRRLWFWLIDINVGVILAHLA